MLLLQCVAAAPASRSPHLWRTTPTAAATPAGLCLHLPERPHWAQRCRRLTKPSEAALALATMTLAVDCSGRSTAMLRVADWQNMQVRCEMAKWS